jgi:SAM-dependent methyltransferase
MNLMQDSVGSIKSNAGRLLASLFPLTKHRVAESLTIPDAVLTGDGVGTRRFERLIRHYLCNQTVRLGPASIENMHKEFWSRNKEFYRSTSKRTRHVYIPEHQVLLDHITRAVKERGIKRICELGTGDGQWLYYLSYQLPRIKEFIGVDINANQISENTKRYRNIRFCEADIADWISENNSDRTLYVTNGGVFEYLCEKSLEKLLSTLSHSAKGSALVSVEPIYGNYNLDCETTSKVSNQEYSFTHNYPHLFSKVGLSLEYSEEKDMLGQRMLTIIGYT